MNYQGIDRWNQDNLSHSWSRYTAHKYYKKVGEGTNARYFYSQEEYNRFLKGTQSQGDRATAIKNQKDYLDRKLTTLKAFGKKRSDITSKRIATANSRLAKGNSAWNKADWLSNHTVGTKAKSVSTLKKSAQTRKAQRDAFAALNREADEAGKRAHQERRGKSTLRSSMKKRAAQRNAFTAINKAAENIQRASQKARKGVGTLKGSIAKRNKQKNAYKSLNKRTVNNASKISKKRAARTKSTLRATGAKWVKRIFGGRK